MTDQTAGEPPDTRHPILAALAHHRRRRIMSVLLDRSSPVTEEDLAIQIAAVEGEKSMLDVTESETNSIRTDLTHVQLPALAEAGLVDRDEASATITTTTHPVFEDHKFEGIIHGEADNWDAVLANLAYKRRRIILSVLKDEASLLSREALVRAVANYERDEGIELDAEAIEERCAALHHVDLPQLAAVGLVEYDPTSGMSTYGGHPELGDTWFDFQMRDTPRPILTVAEQSDDIWGIEGRDNVTERGRALCDYADEELFMMFTKEGLLEEACYQRIQSAVDRGVAVYLGSQTPELRDAVRREVPGVTLWEPQMDWLNLPPTRETVGRLILADREAVMLGSLGEQTDKGLHEETAITGTGENNAIVMLLRELLGSRLDHLDEQSEDFLSEIPL